MPLVKIKPGLSHGYYDMATKSRAYYQAGDEFNASPAEMESFGDKFLQVAELVSDEPEPTMVDVGSLHSSATRGAIKLATEQGISLPLSGITGSGRSGRITKADVEAFLNGSAE